MKKIHVTANLTYTYTVPIDPSTYERYQTLKARMGHDAFTNPLDDHDWATIEVVEKLLMKPAMDLIEATDGLNFSEGEVPLEWAE